MVEIHDNDLNSLLNSFHEGICCFTSQGEVQCYNQMAQTHWNGEQFLKYNLTTLPVVARGLAGEEVQQELVHVSEQKTLLVNIKPLYEGKDALSKIVIISSDVSDSVQLERQAEIALHVLIEATYDTTQVEQIDEALRRVTALLPQLEAVDHGIAFRCEGTALLPVAIFGTGGEQTYGEWHSELMAAKLSTEGALQYPGSAYLHALQLARPVMIDFSENTKFYTNAHNLQAAVYAPVLVDGTVVGLLGMERGRPRDALGDFFPQWSVELLTAIARLTSMTLEKTMLLQSAAQLQGEVDMVHKLRNQKEEFLLLAAHELKNPLTAIRGQSQVLRRRIHRSLHSDIETTEEDMHELLKHLASIERQTQRIEHLINTLLTTSRVDLDRLDLHLQSLDLVQIAKQMVELHIPQNSNCELQLFVEGMPVQLGVDRQANIPVLPIIGDEVCIEQMLTNLLNNAIRYSPQGGLIIIELKRKVDGFVELSIEDQGIGIPLDEMPHLTERFYRANNARNVNRQGLGLGLYLVNELIKRHGGHLSIESKGIPGEGSTFRITFVDAP